jgi:DDE superfamily endonuclease
VGVPLNKWHPRAERSAPPSLVAHRDPAQLGRSRTRLTAFAEDSFASIARRDQRRWGQSDLRGLVLDGKDTSIQPMATRLARGDLGADAAAIEPALPQVVNQSPGDPVPVRRRLAERLTTAIQPAAWVVDDTALPRVRPPAVGVAPRTVERWPRWPTARSAGRSMR